MTQAAKSDAPQLKTQSSEPQYVIVTDGDEKNGERLELPVDPVDNSLGLNTLSHAFPGAYGLKYKNPTSGAYRGLLIDASGTKLLPPADGWGDAIYLVIYQNPPPAAVHQQYRNNDQNTKRKKMMDSADESDGETGSDGGGATAKQKRLDSRQGRNEADGPIPDQKCSDLIVLGLPFKTTNNELKEYFEQFGEVVVSEVKSDFKSGKSKGFGFVQFVDYDSQLKVLAQQVHYIDGRSCQVKIPNSKADVVAETTCPKMFVGRVPEKMAADELRDFFNAEAKKINPQANVVDVFIPRPFRAFAFVTFSDPKVNEEIIKKQDFVINGASITVSVAAPKDSAASGASGTSNLSPRGAKRTSNSATDSKFYYAERRQDNPADHYFDAALPYSYDARSHAYDAYDGPPGLNRSTVEMEYRWSDAPPGPVRESRGMGTASSSRFSPVPPAPRPLRPTPPSSSSRAAPSSNALASGMDALNLNQMNQTLSQMSPDAVTAAWQAFWTTLQQSGQPIGVPQWQPPHSEDRPSSQLPPPHPSNRRE
uniref:RRM domain-containing protein n=1 Tax=Plectus sambesii TaxID=2011161 RepID=A0A914WL17_9BILA